MIWLFILITTLTAFTSAHYIASNQSDCPPLTNTSILCQELAFYTSRAEDYFTDNSVYIFLEGVHVLEDVVLIDSVSNITLSGNEQKIEQGFHETVVQSTVVLSCNRAEMAGIMFINVTNLNLLGITITNCSYSPSSLLTSSKSVSAFYSYLSDSHTYVHNSSQFYSSVFMIEVTNLVFTNMSILNTTNFGLVTINVYNSTIASSSFAINNIEHFMNSEDCSVVGGLDCSASNLLVMYTYSWILKCNAMSMKAKLEITNSNFSNGFGNTRYSHFVSYGGGVVVFMDQGDLYFINVTIDQIILYNNTGQLCGNVNFLTGMKTLYFDFSLTNSISSFGNQRLKSNASSGGGLQVYLGVASTLINHECIEDNTANTLNVLDSVVHIVNSTFNENIGRYGAGINIWANQTYADIYIGYCRIIHNHGWRGIGMYINQNNFDTILNYVFEEVVVSQSSYLGTMQSSEDYKSSISLFRMRNFKFINLVVEDNYPNFGVYLYYSTITFSGTSNIFRNCSSAGSGGGLHLSALSTIIIESNTVIIFDNNHVDGQGGAIYAETAQLLRPLCFIEIYYPSSLIFINNTAGKEGDAIYIGQCSRLQNDVEETNKAIKILNVLDISQQPGEQPIASIPYSVKYCDNINDTISEEIDNINMTAFPGEIIRLRIATQGITNATSSGLVKIDVFSEHDYSKIETIYRYSQSQCFNIEYHIVEIPNITRLLLEITTNHQQFTSTGYNLQKVVSVSLNVKICPKGFELFENQCVCNRLLADIIGTITTDVSTNTFTREGNVWFGFDNDTDALLVDPNCPFDYCRKTSISFPIHNSNDQCNLNRSGIVCGECADGLSLMLGSNLCGRCSNLWLLLIIPFSIGMGVALVVLLIVLNLTVSIGTINGLVFYANVIKMSEYAFFPNGSVYILSQFIAWINLDLGISTCFYDGFNVIGKLWVQFLFPAYIFALIIFIIFLCKMSTKAATVFGHNAVQVFATLILLSYTKLIRLIVPIMQFKHIKIISNTTSVMDRIVWPVDSSIQYSSYSHMSLVAIASIIVLFLIIPYTTVLIFQPIMLKFRQACFQKLCLNFKPLFDAYYGPFKTKSKIWPGLLLCARLFLVTIASISSDTKMYLSCSITIVLILLTVMIALQGVYTNTYLNILESSFLLNLALIGIFVEKDHYITIAGVTMAMMVFIGIVLFHVCKKPATRKVYKHIFKKDNSIKESDILLESSGVHVTRNSVLSSSIDTIMREPLIFEEEERNIH